MALADVLKKKFSVSTRGKVKEDITRETIQQALR